MRCSSFLPVAALALSGCGVPAPPGPGSSAEDVVLEPPAALGAARPVFRARWSRASVEPAAVLLFADELSSYAVGRIRSGAVPSTLSERQISVVAWKDVGGGMIVAPLQVFRPGDRLSLAALGVGLLADVRVSEDAELGVVRRVFPRPGAAARRWVFCGEAGSVAAAAGVVDTLLDPGAIFAQAAPGADSAGTDAARCVHLDIAPPAEASPNGVVPPVTEFDALLEPIAGSVAAPGAAAPAARCSPPEISLGPGCATVLDDRAIVRGPSAPVSWALRTESGALVLPTDAGSRFVLPGLTPESDVRISGTATDADGAELPFEVVVRCGAAMPHVVINEVLANPRGGEPQQEWIELVNDGRAPVDLGRFLLGDPGGESPLPPALLEPGRFALVVLDSYDASSELDVRPVAGTLLLRVPRLGAHGLSNSGERLVLRSMDGTIASEFPAIPSPRAGVSLSRRRAATLDDDPTGFAESDDPGASPGSVNRAFSP